MTCEEINQEIERLRDLLLRNHTNSGGSAGKPPCLTPSVSTRTALLVRASDKAARIAALSAGDPDRVAEPLEEAVRDLAGYCVLWLACALSKTREPFETEDREG